MPPSTQGPTDLSPTGRRGVLAAAQVPPARSTGVLEEAQVRAMFDRIAGLYDRMNSLMTAGLHHRWRERAAELAAVPRGGTALDVATGTGDLALALARRVGPTGEVVGVDFSERMLELARRKAATPRMPATAGPAPVGEATAGQATVGQATAGRVRFELANALELPYRDGTFDAATVGFGARNFANLERGVAEMVRVVRPGGRVVILEITSPSRPPLSLFFRLWFDRLVPALGRLAGDPDAYAYLPSSVRRFPGPAELAALMARSGLREIRYRLTAGGIIALHVGVVSER